jgi:Zn-dependent protease
VLGDHWWVSQAWEQGPAFLASWVVWVLLSISLHELGHGWAAIRRGDRTPIETGHMTWNPVVHMGVPSLIVFGLLGIAWGAMPVDPRRLKGRYASFVVAAAGPMMNLSLGVVSIVLGAVWLAFGARVSPHESFFMHVLEFWALGASLNIVLLVLNLMPVPPLDGSRMLMDVWPAFERWSRHDNAPVFGLMFLVAVFFFGSEYLWALGFGGAWGGIAYLAGLLGAGAPT